MHQFLYTEMSPELMYQVNYHRNSPIEQLELHGDTENKE